MNADDYPLAPSTAGSWVPANEVERRLLAAATAADAAEVLRILAVVPLVLPGFSDGTGPSSSVGRQRLLTRERDGVPYLLVFTSPEAMHRIVTADGWRVTNLPELVRAWPDLDPGAAWGLAVNPATPIGVLVAPGEVPTLVPTPALMADFVPANEVERLLRDALAAPDGEVLLDVLVTAQVIVATRALEVDGVPTVAVFTSQQRWAEFLDGIDVPAISVDLVRVLRQWPDARHRLAVNPGSRIAFSLSGARVPALLTYAAGLVRRRLGDDAVAPAPTTTEPVSDVPAVMSQVDRDLPVALPSGGIADVLRG